MRNEKHKDIIIGILVAVIVILIVIIGFVYNENKSYKETNNTDKQAQDNIVNDENEQNDNEGANNNNEYGENDYIRQTKVTLIEEPACNGYDSSATVVASIEEDGTISISQGKGAIKVEPGNAKYLYHVGKLACSAVSLYYITEDNELYVLDEPIKAVDQVATKVTDDKVVEFLGTGLDGNNHYLKVLLENGEVRHISYLVTLS